MLVFVNVLVLTNSFLSHFSFAFILRGILTFKCIFVFFLIEIMEFLGKNFQKLLKIKNILGSQVFLKSFWCFRPKFRYYNLLYKLRVDWFLVWMLSLWGVVSVLIHLRILILIVNIFRWDFLVILGLPVSERSVW